MLHHDVLEQPLTQSSILSVGYTKRRLGDGAILGHMFQNKPVEVIPFFRDYVHYADGYAPPPLQSLLRSPPPLQRAPGTLTAEEYGCNLKNGAWVPVYADGCAPPPPQCLQPSPPPPQLRVDKKRAPGTLTAEEYGCNLKDGAWVPVFEIGARAGV